MGGSKRRCSTGNSSIAAEGALRLQVITRRDLEREGVTSAEQVIMMLSVNGNGLDSLASNADVLGFAQRGNNGATSSKLRGQGSNATLILLNGRRVAAHGLNGGTVDLNRIPVAAIERIEILNDGASASCGTDAIGGVINFIMRKNFTGGSAPLVAEVAQEGGGNIFRGSLVGGWGNICCRPNSLARRATRPSASPTSSARPTRARSNCASRATKVRIHGVPHFRFQAEAA